MKNLEARYDKYRAYKSEGHSMKEVAEHFGISEATAVKACRGIAPQKSIQKGESPAWMRNQYTSGSFDREANAKRYVDERTPGFEYAGGFTGIDGYIDLKCKKCGAIQHRSMVSVRHGHATCDNCKRIDIESRAAAKNKEAEEKRTARKQQAIKNKINHETNLFIKTILVECEECGTIFATRKTRQVCCSQECSRKRMNRIASHRKDARIAADKRIDRDITAKKLYYRDGGVCWICGKPCDIDDYEEKDGTVVCGDNYPSVDHVVPISEGGTDSWDNVKLAHRSCNTKRFWRKPPPHERLAVV